MKITILSHNNEGVDNSASRLAKYIVDNYGFESNVLDFRNFLWEREKHYGEVGEIVIPRVTRMGRVTSSIIVNELENLGKFIFPRTILEDPNLGNKNYQQSIMKHANIIPCIDTFTIVKSTDVQKIIDSGALRFPFIFKPNSSSEGRGIHLVNSIQEWEKLVPTLETEEGKFFTFSIQNFIPNNHDYRIYVIGGKGIAAMKRIRKSGYLNNFSQGGSVENVPLDSEVGKKICKYAEEICKFVNIDVAGVDILEDLNGNLYFMEINTSAQWEGLEIASGVDVSKIFIDVCLEKYREHLNK